MTRELIEPCHGAQADHSSKSLKKEPYLLGSRSSVRGQARAGCGARPDRTCAAAHVQVLRRMSAASARRKGVARHTAPARHTAARSAGSCQAAAAAGSGGHRSAPTQRSSARFEASKKKPTNCSAAHRTRPNNETDNRERKHRARKGSLQKSPQERQIGSSAAFVPATPPIQSSHS